MSSDEKLMEQINTLLTERSKKALALSKQAVLQEQIKYEPLHQALRYFMEEICYDTGHPTLLSLACEAVGGNPDTTVGVGAAIILLSGAADIHDDIIDKSKTKNSKPTVYGKFGEDMAIITADVLWIKGMQMLNEACEIFPEEKKQLILKLTKQAFFDIGSAEAQESSIKGNIDLDPEDLLELIKLKISVGTASAQIGAIIGNGTFSQIESLGQYGKSLGILMTVREEFINMFEPEELTNRFKNECLPLPILYAFKDAALKQKILEFLKQDVVTEAELEKMLEPVYADSEVRKLSQYLHLLAKEATEKVQYKKETHDAMSQLLKFSLQGLPD
jgi:geranylgeranyl pyrophosphate synthase